MHSAKWLLLAINLYEFEIVNAPIGTATQASKQASRALC